MKQEKVLFCYKGYVKYNIVENEVIIYHLIFC